MGRKPPSLVHNYVYRFRSAEEAKRPGQIPVDAYKIYRDIGLVNLYMWTPSYRQQVDGCWDYSFRSIEELDILAIQGEVVFKTKEEFLSDMLGWGQVLPPDV